MPDRKPNFSQKVRYSFDNFMSKGGLSVFFALMTLFVGAIVIIAILRFVANIIMPQDGLGNLADQWWLSFLQIADGGSIAEDTGSNAVNRVVGIIALFLGMVLFSSLVAFITSQFEAMLENMRKGKSDVIESDHTLILGFGDRALEIIRELIVANESERKAAVVVLAENEKDEMDDFFRERVENPKTTHIITRSGSTSSIMLLKRVSVNTAKSVIILNDASDDASDEDKAYADARVLKTILAVLSCTGEQDMPPIVAELHLPEKQKLAKTISDKVSIIDENSILSKLIVQTSRVSGLVSVYDHLVGFEGNEFYFHKPSEGWGKKSYGDLILHYAECCVIGVRDKNGSIQINPKSDRVVADDEELLLVAEDDSAIKLSKVKIPVKDIKPGKGKVLPKVIENELIVGWGQKASLIIEEYISYLIKGSQIDVMIHADDIEAIKEFEEIPRNFPDYKIGLIKADASDSDLIKNIKPEQYDNIIILSGDGENAELNDSETISKLLQFRAYFRESDIKDLKTQLISEVSDSENIDIIKEAGVKDFLISNQFVSKMYAQVSEESGVLDIYNDLFSEDGSELYIKPVNLYFDEVKRELNFAEICVLASLRGESCIGVKLIAEEKNEKADFGVYINPPKSKKFILSQGDCFITLAEDET